MEIIPLAQFGSSVALPLVRLAALGCAARGCTLETSHTGLNPQNHSNYPVQKWAGKEW